MLSPEDTTVIKNWLMECGNLASEHQAGIAYELKKDFTPVTAVEYQIEQTLAERLTGRFAGDQIVTEEHGVLNAYNERLWALDPIDGTRAFISGLPTWGISLGLLNRGIPEAGFFYMPVLKEMYWSWEGGAYLNDMRLDGRAPIALDDPLGFLCVPSNAFRHFDINYPRIRSLGSTAYHLALVGRGAACGVLTRNVSIWDIAGTLPLLARAGIQVEYYSGKAFNISSLLDGKPMNEPMLAANPAWMEKLRSLIQVKHHKTE